MRPQNLGWPSAVAGQDRVDSDPHGMRFPSNFLCLTGVLVCTLMPVSSFAAKPEGLSIDTEVLTTTKQPFDLFGLSVNPVQIKQKTPPKNKGALEFYGAIKVTLGGSDFTATFGTERDPGFVIKSNAISSVDIVLSGEKIKIGSMDFELDDDNPLHIVYKSGVLALSGTVKSDIAIFEGAELTMGSSDSPGITIEKGDLKVESIKLYVEQVEAGAYTLKDVLLTYKEIRPLDFKGIKSIGLVGANVGVGYEFHGECTFVLPDDTELTAKITFVNGNLHEIGVIFVKEIPLGATGFTIVSVEADVKNIDQPGNLAVHGEIGLNYGKTVSIGSHNGTMLHIHGAFDVDKNHLSMTNVVYIGAYESGGEWTAVWGTGHLDLDLNWSKGVYKLHGDISVPPNPGAEATVDVMVGADGMFLFDGKCDFKVPDDIDIIGGEELFSIELMVDYEPAHLAKSFAAGITELWAIGTVGAAYYFKSGSIELLGAEGVENLRAQYGAAEAGRQPSPWKTVTVDFEIKETANAVLLSLIMDKAPFPPILVSGYQIPAKSVLGITGGIAGSIAGSISNPRLFMVQVLYEEGKLEFVPLGKESSQAFGTVPQIGHYKVELPIITGFDFFGKTPGMTVKDKMIDMTGYRYTFLAHLSPSVMQQLLQKSSSSSPPKEKLTPGQYRLFVQYPSSLGDVKIVPQVQSLPPQPAINVEKLKVMAEIVATHISKISGR